MTANPIKNIIITGAGLAAWMTAATLAKNLPSAIQITVLETPNSDTADIFYGSVTSPNSYNFFLNLGLTEADLLTRTQTSFSYGTKYDNWGLSGVSWTQCFHSPFPSWSGVPFSHHISTNTRKLENYLVSAKAGAEGKFAHPPTDKNIALSSAEYGYHIKTSEITKLIKLIAIKNGVKSQSRQITSVECRDGNILELRLNDGHVLSADLYIDASGPNAALISSLEADDVKISNQRLGILYSEQPNTRLGPPLRHVTSHDFGWQSVTSLQNTDAVMTVFDVSYENSAIETHPTYTVDQLEVSLNQRTQPWRGNCASVGHAAAIVEPTSPAPIMLLQMDIDRLLGLIPVTSNFSIEASIFNDAFQTDVENIQLFNTALFQLDDLTQTAYWSTAKTDTPSEKLDRKLQQFSHRGLLVTYDLEPFNDEDWTILHHGTGRKPRRKDVFAALLDAEKISQALINKADSIQEIVTKMPPHHIYMANYLNYLERNHVSDL